MGISARALERHAKLPPMTMGLIKQGSHPRSDRFDRLLQAIPGITHRTELLIAYVLDDCPAAYTAATEAILREHLFPWLQARQADPDTTSRLDDAAPRCLPLSTATLARQVLSAMAQRLVESDARLADWLADPGQLLTAAHLPAKPLSPKSKRPQPAQAGGQIFDSELEAEDHLNGP
jgi:hypothetical protein